MPSVGNPNGPSRNRLANRLTKQKAQRRKRSEHARHKIAKSDTTRGARPGLMATSGPNAPISKKKAKKIEQQLKLAERRRVEAEGLEGMGCSFRSLQQCKHSRVNVMC